MKTVSVPALLATLSILLLPHAFGQGTLTPPPGPPAPSMKSLDQVEPRVLMSAINTPGDVGSTFIISAPGSYYLTGNFIGEPGKHGISIQANDVTLDLNGFALISGGGGATRGINVPALQSGICIRNGNVRGWTDDGIHGQLATMLAEKLSLTNNTGSIGLAVGNGSLVKDCVASGNRTGFTSDDRAQFSNCISTVNSGNGFDCASFVSLLDCTASRNGGDGIVVQESSSVIRCNASRNIPLNGSSGGSGIRTGAGCTIVDCTAGSNRFTGIVTYESSVAGSTTHSNSLSGISASSSSVINCRAAYNGVDGISGGSVANCQSSNNGYYGINVGGGGSVTNSTSRSNGRSGVICGQGSITNCVSSSNGDNGIDGFQSVISFCRAFGNNLNNNGSVQINGVGATLVSNNTDPTP